MKAVIIAGGRGERLRPLTDKIPKPIIKVGDKPILEYIINLFKKNGVVDLVLALCYLPQPIINYFADGSKFGVNITYTFESPNLPMGTAGAILPAKNLISSTFIVTYADILRDLQIDEMIKFHSNSKNMATINVYKHTGTNFKSAIKFTKDNLLKEFEEFDKSKDLAKGYKWSNGSFYIFEPEIFGYIPKNKKSDFSQDIFPKLLKLNKKVSVFPSSSYFLDIGTKANLQQARNDLKLKSSVLIKLRRENQQMPQ